MKRKIVLVTIICIALLGLAAAVVNDNFRNSITTQGGPAAAGKGSLDNQNETVRTVAQKLDTPWAVAVLPDDKILITERAGTVSILGADGARIPVADVVERGEGGLLGLALHPEFGSNGQLYIYKTTNQTNVVERYRLVGNQLVERQEILTSIPAANVHNGGEIKFGPDGKLYIATGDAAVTSRAQDKGSLAGKILRINPDGSVPTDNPFGSLVWSYGHRNPQGLAWDGQDRLWSTEHGPSGAETGHDELNLIQKGGNYGWPLVRGDETSEGLIAPVAQSGTSETWAPAGMTYADGSLYFTGLRGQTLYQAKITGNSVTITKHLAEEYGRLRAVTFNRQDLLISTSNRDGRGTPNETDDRILRVPLAILRD